jgi:hypothetical protein
MAGSINTRVINDGGNTAFPGGLRLFDVSGTGAGPWVPLSVLYDPNSGAIGTIKPASTAVAATDPALVVALSQNSATLSTNSTIVNANPNGPVFAVNSAPVTQAPTTFRVAQTPTVTAGAYVAGNVLGGVLTFASALLAAPTATPTKWSAILESISVKFKASAATGEIDVAIFTAALTGTYTDHAAPTWNAADAAKLVGVYALPTPQSTLGTMTCYNLDGIGAAIDGASTSLFAVVTVKGTPTPASTSDVIVELGVLQG